MAILLPIGSVVSFKGSPEKFMIYGRLQKTPDKEHIYDYCACSYPTGHMTAERNIVFDHESIDMLYFIGFQDTEELNFRQALSQEHDRLRSGGTNPSADSSGLREKEKEKEKAACPSCGQMVAVGKKFCPTCGKPMKIPSQQESEIVPEDEE